MTSYLVYRALYAVLGYKYNSCLKSIISNNVHVDGSVNVNSESTPCSRTRSSAIAEGPRDVLVS